MMKYDPSSVISQMTTKRTRPIERASPSLFRPSPGAPRNFPPLAPWGIQNGANISQVILEASKFLQGGKIKNNRLFVIHSSERETQVLYLCVDFGTNDLLRTIATKISY